MVPAVQLGAGAHAVHVVAGVQEARLVVGELRAAVQNRVWRPGDALVADPGVVCSADHEIVWLDDHAIQVDPGCGGCRLGGKDRHVIQGELLGVNGHRIVAPQLLAAAGDAVEVVADAHQPTASVDQVGCIVQHFPLIGANVIAEEIGAVAAGQNVEPVAAVPGQPAARTDDGSRIRKRRPGSPLVFGRIVAVKGSAIAAGQGVQVAGRPGLPAAGAQVARQVGSFGPRVAADGVAVELARSAARNGVQTAVPVAGNGSAFPHEIGEHGPRLPGGAVVLVERLLAQADPLAAIPVGKAESRVRPCQGEHAADVGVAVTVNDGANAAVDAAVQGMLGASPAGEIVVVRHSVGGGTFSDLGEVAADVELIPHNL